MKHFPFVVAAVAAAFTVSAQAETYQSAMTALEIADPDGDRNLEGFLWYPTDAEGPLTYDFESEVWAGTRVVKDADVAEGAFPLVVLSHGMFGNALNQAWFAGALAKEEPGDEIICMNGGEQRAAKHDMIVDAVLNFFAQ
ncbi:hypothetical protein [Aliiroseovarius sp. YM-037]|uniref:hypothetical protein n=1 Tax=Aliiroseovarius sp. YM-037 TaxID=3341728 RepID=UPI003A80062C